MRRKIVSIAVAAALSGGMVIAGVGAAQAAPATAPASVSQAAQRATAAPVSINQVLADGSTLAGTFSLTRFVDQGGQLVAQGVFNGTLTSATGVVTQLTNVVGTSAVTGASNGTPAACNVLSLTLGPLHLDVLGLVVDLNQVNLNITAQPGSGNLLGNLLCNVARLLDNGTGLQGLTNLLNNLLGAL